MPLYSAMRPICFAGFAGFALAACETQPNSTTVSASGATEIRIQPGLNCYDNKCFKYNSNGSISVNVRKVNDL